MLRHLSSPAEGRGEEELSRLFLPGKWEIEFRRRVRTGDACTTINALSYRVWIKIGESDTPRTKSRTRFCETIMSLHGGRGPGGRGARGEMTNVS